MCASSFHSTFAKPHWKLTKCLNMHLFMCRSHTVEWLLRLNCGQMSVGDPKCLDCPSTSRSEDNVEKVHHVFHEVRLQISNKL